MGGWFLVAQMAEAATKTTGETSSAMLAAHSELAASCASQSAAFMDCKARDADPRQCLAEGEKVISCFAATLKNLRAKCPDAINGYVACLDANSQRFEACRKEEEVYK